MDFTYRNGLFDMKQLVEVLQIDLQVTIHEGLMETISSFVDHFQSEITTLSPPQMHSLLDHLQARCGGQVLLDAIQRGETSNLA